MRLSASAISTNAGLSIVFRMSVIVSVTLGEVPATCHNARSASASSGRHSRMKNGTGSVFVLSDKSIFVSGAVANRTYKVWEGEPIRQANSSCCADSCRPLLFRVLPPADGARPTRVDSPHSPKPIPVRRPLPARPLRFGASCLGHCRQ